MSRLWLVVGALVLVLVVVKVSYGAPGNTCQPGRTRGFAALRSNPVYLPGSIPSAWVSTNRWFTRRYNCTGQGVFVRRVDLGTYDVRFIGQRPKVAVVTAISDSGVAASAKPFGDFVRVVLRGAFVGSDIGVRRDVAFSIVVF